MIRRAAEDYCKIRHCSPDFVRSVRNAAILRTPSGKPYFDGPELYFSVSHSGNLWACAFGGSPLGLDVQEMRPRRYDRLMRRFFTENEWSYSEIFEPEGMYDIWVRKEAYGKMTGGGVFSEMPDMAGDPCTRDFLRAEAVYEGETYYIRGFSPCSGFRGAICSKSRDQEVRMLP